MTGLCKKPKNGQIDHCSWKFEMTEFFFSKQKKTLLKSKLPLRTTLQNKNKKTFKFLKTILYGIT